MSEALTKSLNEFKDEIKEITRDGSDDAMMSISKASYPKIRENKKSTWNPRDATNIIFEVSHLNTNVHATHVKWWKLKKFKMKALCPERYKKKKS